MATTAILGSQTTLQRGDGASPENFVNVYEVVTISEFGQQNDLVEATHLLSAAKEYIYGLADGVEPVVTVNYKPTDPTHQGLQSDQANRVTRNFKIKLPTSPVLTFSFAALVRGWRLNFSSNEPIHEVFNLKITGPILGPS
jgi:Lambda phage tail tube protein, TTP